MKTAKAGSLIFILVAMVFESNGQLLEKKLYDPKADAARDISSAIKKARAEHKHVLLEAGGNWCSWCIEFGRFSQSDPSIDSLLGKSYIIYHLNYSKENTNKDLFAAYGYPQRFGFPVFIVLDENGNRIHTQNSEYLEQGKSYSKEKVMEFLVQWTPQALDPESYKQ
ncbi:MAG: thioredoxin family protein [Chitinophagales bacterium]